MRRDLNFTSILDGYSRIALTIGVLVAGVIVSRLLAFFSLLPPQVSRSLPLAGLVTAAILIAILVYGHRWLSRRLGMIATQTQEARARSNRDALTGVFNRSYFLDALSEEVFHGAQRPVGYLQLDMDNLKALNDTAGHSAGDAALMHLTQIIAHTIPGAIIGRLGGDEFGIIIVGHDNKAALRRLGEELLRQLDRPVSISGRPTRLSASIGLALSPQDASDPVDLIAKADLALYKAKHAGRHAVVSFERDMLGDERQRRFVERDLRAALLLDELELHYQPVFDIDMAIRSHEALVRWRHPVRGMIPPVEFIPIAEESDLIDKLGDWVLRRICADLWLLGGTPVAINVSPMQLRRADFAERFAAIVTETGADPRRIIVEITETAPFQALEAEMANLATLRALGVRIAVDDFGAGHASLQYLRGFAFDIIKIDRSYVSNLTNSRVDNMIVTAICNIARSLPAEIIAEGIETDEQLKLLRIAGCTGFQGYLLGRPQPLGHSSEIPKASAAA